MDWPRLFWTLGAVLLILALWGLLALGWRRRARRQADIPAPVPPPPPLPADLAEPLEGVYVATTRSGAWQDRVVVHTLGRRARVTAHATAEGVLLDRVGEDPIWLPADSITLVDNSPGIAGKVMGVADGILVISWRLGNRLLDTGLRADDLDAQHDWIDAVRGTITQAGTFHDEDDNGDHSRTDGAEL